MCRTAGYPAITIFFFKKKLSRSNFRFQGTSGIYFFLFFLLFAVCTQDWQGPLSLVIGQQHSLFQMPSSPWPPAAGAPPPPPQRAAQGTVSTVAPEPRPVEVPLPSHCLSLSGPGVHSARAQAQLTWPHHLGFPISPLEGDGGHGSASVCGLLLVRPSHLLPLSRARAPSLCNCRPGVVQLHRELPTWFGVHELSAFPYAVAV